MQRRRTSSNGRLRRAVVAVYVAISMTVTMGMAALAIDIGVLYQAQAELQRSADSAALAAAARLIGAEAQNPDDPNSPIPLDPIDAAVDSARDMAERNMVLRQFGSLDTGSDVEFGQAVYSPSSDRFEFVPGGDNFDSVRVTIRRTQGSDSGPIELIFARFLGHSTRGLEARAAAVLVPRDISLVIDLSNSMNWDSQLRFWDRGDGGYANTRDIWCALDGWEPSRPYMPGSELETEYASDTGPSIGDMNVWGDALLPGSYSPSSDPGLWYIRKQYDVTDANLLGDLVSRGYTGDEISAMTSNDYDGDSTLWRNRVAVMLGLATWRSGMPGALYSGDGDGDNKVENGEVDWIPKPEFRVDWSWTSYINWMQYGGRGGFRHRYGLKTFTDFLLENEPSLHETNNLWATPQQPLRAVKDAVQVMTDVIAALDSLDHVSLEIFATTTEHEIGLTDDLQSIPNRLYQMQSGHYDRCTNIGGGIGEAIVELQSGRARGNAHKVILLMSDGVANIDEDGDYGESQAARDYATRKAEDAADLGFRIYTISVGYNVDRNLMQEIAAIGEGQEFYAVGTPEEYTAQLEMIFRALGGKRAVALIE